MEEGGEVVEGEGFEGGGEVGGGVLETSEDECVQEIADGSTLEGRLALDGLCRTVCE